MEIKNLEKYLEFNSNYAFYDELCENAISKYDAIYREIEKLVQETALILNTVEKKKFDFKEYIASAKKIYQDAKELNEKADFIHENIDYTSLEADSIPTLSKSAYASWDKGIALEKYVEAKQLIESFEMIKSMIESDKDFEDLLRSLNEQLKTIRDEKESFIKKYKLNRVHNPYTNSSFNSKFNSNTNAVIKKLEDEIINLKETLVKCLLGGALQLCIATADLAHICAMARTDNELKHPFIAYLILVVFGVSSLKNFNKVSKIENNINDLLTERKKLIK